MNDSITVGIVEDDVDIRRMLQNYFEAQPDISFAGGFDSVERLINKLMTTARPPDVLLMDIGLPGMSGIDGIKLLKEKYPSIEFVVFTIYDDTTRIFNSLCAGATGYLLKNTPLNEIREGIGLLKMGGSPMSPQIARQVINLLKKDFKQPAPRYGSILSEREKEIVVGLVDGLSYKLIADRLSVSIETVRFHIKSIYRKLHVHCRSEVISRSLRGEI